MKCLVVFLITLGLAMSFPHMPINDAARDPEERDPMELENTMTHGKSISLLQVAVFIQKVILCLLLLWFD